LSLKAIGLLTQLMSHRPGWNMSISSLARFNKTGVDTIKSAVKELELYGYLHRSEKQEHNDDGTFADYVWTTADPFQNPDTVKPVSGKQDTKNTITKEQQPIKNKQENTDTGFDKFWELYPKKVAKADALKAWKQVLKKKTADEMIALTKAYSESKLPDMTYIPYPASWLNKELYESIDLASAQPKEFKTGVFYK
jgi:hydroxymethylpyrimidine pyrophosphatase-like HAD family hydrolase